MKAVLDRAAALLLGLCAGVAQAVDEGGALAPEPTVSVFWVIAFMVIFFVVCAWIGIAIWRNERRNDPKRGQDARS
jgi:hypothetical protein